jgi:G:T-mismatch repair DNA endonuclease (very short patch repair protein)
MYPEARRTVARSRLRSRSTDLEIAWRAALTRTGVSHASLELRFEDDYVAEVQSL